MIGIARGERLGSLRRREHGGRKRHGLSLPQLLVTQEDEQLVLDDGAAAIAAELVADELRFPRSGPERYRRSRRSGW